MNRREFVASAGVLLAGHGLNALGMQKGKGGAPAGKADHALRIEPCTLEIGP